MKVIGIDPGKTGGIFIYETQPIIGGSDGRHAASIWFPHTYEWKPYRAIPIPLIVPPVILTLKRDAKGKRKKKQPKSTIDWDTLAVTLIEVVKFCKETGPVEAFVERVSGSVSTGPQVGSFNFGVVYGFLRGVLAGMGVKVTLVNPAVWKAAVGIVNAPVEKPAKRKKGAKKAPAPKPKKGDPKPPKKATEDKNVSRAVASKFFPGAANEWALAKQDGLAEAALICQYGMQQLGVDL